MEDRHGHRISYLRISITDRCNERCRYCLPDEKQEWLPREGILSYEEILRVVGVGASLGIRKVRVTGGEPLTRRGVLGFFKSLMAIEGIEEVGISTNATLLARPLDGMEKPAASVLAELGVKSVNVSLDTLDRKLYQNITGRDYLPRALDGIDAAIQAGIPQVKLNAVLMRGQTEAALSPLMDFAHEKGVLLRFIELMPVSTRDVLSEEQFLPVARAKALIEETFGQLLPDPHFKTNGPASYYRLEGRDQRIGFIGAMTNLHFCESCNKLRLTCDGKLRPCLGSWLEFDFLPVVRKTGVTDEELANFFKMVVDRKPKDHDFRDDYAPNRKMIAIGG